MLRSPLSPRDPPSDEEEGWANLEDAPVKVEPQSLQRTRSMDMDADDVVDADRLEESQAPRGVAAPNEPSPTEVAKHNLTHFPYRSWCPHCLACRRPNNHHRQSNPSLRRKIPLSAPIIVS